MLSVVKCFPLNCNVRISERAMYAQVSWPMTLNKKIALSSTSGLNKSSSGIEQYICENNQVRKHETTRHSAAKCTQPRPDMAMPMQWDILWHLKKLWITSGIQYLSTNRLKLLDKCLGHLVWTGHLSFFIVSLGVGFTRYCLVITIWMCAIKFLWRCFPILPFLWGFKFFSWSESLTLFWSRLIVLLLFYPEQLTVSSMILSHFASLKSLLVI